MKVPGYPEKLLKRQQEDMVFLKFTKQVVQRRLQGGRHALLENPLASRAWLTIIGKQLRSMLYEAKVHMWLTT